MASDKFNEIKNASLDEIEELSDDREQKECERQYKKLARRRIDPRNQNPRPNYINRGVQNKKVKGL
jgi:hypothetical protein